MFKINYPTASKSSLMLKVKNSHAFVSRKYRVNPCKHKEPKNISWQWSVRQGPEISKCKELCVSRQCPKPSFFPRFRKVYVPEDMKSCVKKKKRMTLKEFFSFLLPDPVDKPPMTTCRRLHEIRRRCCMDPQHADCFKDDCCPPPTEWYGQAVIYDVPSRFPQPTPVSEPKPCAPPESVVPRCVLAQRGICPQPEEKINMEEYAYKKPFNAAKACTDMPTAPYPFKCSRPCPKTVLPETDKSVKLSCASYNEFKDVELPSQMYTRFKSIELPSLVCSGTEGDTKNEKHDPSAELLKWSCGKSSLQKANSKLTCGKRYFHTEVRPLQLMVEKKPEIVSRFVRLHTSTEVNSSEGSSGQVNKMPPCLLKESHYQPARMGADIRPLLTKAICDFERADGMYNPPEHYIPKFPERYHEVPGIDPELIAMAEKTKQQTHKKKVEHPENLNSLAKLLSKVTVDRLQKEESEKIAKGEKITNSIMSNKGAKSKLSLLAEKSNTNINRTLMTEAAARPSKELKIAPSRTIKTQLGPDMASGGETDNTKKKKEKKKIICSGCPGMKTAEEEEIHPPPEHFIDCKMRSAGKCKVHIGEEEEAPQNPYWQHKSKPYSMCNKPRKPVCIKERGYDIPCEPKGKRKFHSSTALLGFSSESSFFKVNDTQEAHNKKLEKALTNAYYKREWQVDENGGSPLYNIHQQTPEDAADIRESYIKLFTSRAKEQETMKESTTECILERFPSFSEREETPTSSWFMKKSEPNRGFSPMNTPYINVNSSYSDSNLSFNSMNSPYGHNTSPSNGTPNMPFNNANPVFSNVTPSFGNANPSYSNPNPSYSNPNPSMSNAAPPFSNAAPTFSHANPSFSNVSPSFNSTNPSFNNNTNSYGNLNCLVSPSRTVADQSGAAPPYSKVSHSGAQPVQVQQPPPPSTDKLHFEEYPLSIARLTERDNATD